MEGVDLTLVGIAIALGDETPRHARYAGLALLVLLAIPARGEEAPFEAEVGILRFGHDLLRTRRGGLRLPAFKADRDWLHLEARYNYEGKNTASTWMGYRFSAGETLEFEAIPMLGASSGTQTESLRAWSCR